MTTATRNAFLYGMTESLGETAIAYSLTAARYAVIGWDWYTATFFSANAKHVYTTLGEGLGHLMVFSILMGRIARKHYQAWVDATVAECLPSESAPVAEVVEADPFAPEANPHYAAVDAAPAYQGMTTMQPQEAAKPMTKTQRLRTECAAAGIRWRNARGEGRHMTNAQMIEALQNIDCWALSEDCLA